MATFYVGQRVRIIACKPVEDRALIGVETRIERDGGCDWVLAVDWPSRPGVRAREGKGSAASFLAPILDPGLEACDEDFKRSLDELLERQGIAA